LLALSQWAVKVNPKEARGRGPVAVKLPQRFSV